MVAAIRPLIFALHLEASQRCLGAGRVMQLIGAPGAEINLSPISMEVSGGWLAGCAPLAARSLARPAGEISSPAESRVAKQSLWPARGRLAPRERSCPLGWRATRLAQPSVKILREQNSLQLTRLALELGLGLASGAAREHWLCLPVILIEWIQFP